MNLTTKTVWFYNRYGHWTKLIRGPYSSYTWSYTVRYFRRKGVPVAVELNWLGRFLRWLR